MKRIFFAFIFVLLFFSLIRSVAAYTSNFGTIGWHAYSLVLDEAGNIYTANYTDSNVSKVTQAGVSTIFATVGTSPFAITIDASGNLYTANSGSNNVSKITPEGVSTILGTTGSNPSGITIDSAGNIYTSNNGSNNVSKITPEGVSTILGTTGSNPSGIAADGAGNIYTANTWSNNVSKITPEGVSTILGTTGTNPSGIVLDNAGNVYTTNSGSNNVSKITPEGVSTIFASVVSGPAGVVIDGSGNLYVANNQLANSVSKITPAGVSTVVGYTDYAPNGIAIDNDGNVYTANYASNSRNITKFTNPTITEITPIPNLTFGNDIVYVFNSNSAGTISYGGSCDSDTTSATVGSNSITFDPLPVGTYSNCTTMVTDLFGPSNLLAIPSFTISEPPPVITKPVLTTASATVTASSADLLGSINILGGENVTARGFEYGLTASYGSSAYENGSYGAESYNLNITGLSCGTTYHYRAYATNSAGSGFGEDATFTTSNCVVSNSGSSGGGGGGKLKPKIETVCQMGQKFNPLTGKPCTAFTSNPSTSVFVSPSFSPNTFSCLLTATVRFGSRGEQVRCLQNKLNIKADGIFGPFTWATVVFFQKSHGLAPDGVVGPLTRKVMNES